MIVSLIIFLLTGSQHTTQHEQTVNSLETGVYYVTEDSSFVSLYYSKEDKTYFIHPDAIVSIEHFESVSIDNTGDDCYGLTIQVNEAGKQKLTNASTGKKGAQWAFVIKNELWSVPTLYGPLTTGAFTISYPSRSKKYLKDVKRELELDMANS